MAEAKQLNTEEDPLFHGEKLLVSKKPFLNKDVNVYGGYWISNNFHIGGSSEWKTNEVKNEAAIRRIKNEDCLDKWTDNADKLDKLEHNNILRVFAYEEDVTNKWRYFALEPYSATLYEYCNGKYNGPMPNEAQVLYQITNGIFYLHGQEIVHGDLNPLNVVVAAQSLPVRMKISDFGLSKFSYSKQLSEKGEDNISFQEKLCLRKYWTLSEKPDSLEGIEDATEDVIAAGCILFYYLTRGKHLFGTVNDFKSILINLKEKNPVNLWNLGKYHFASEPIKNMITPPGDRFNWLHIANEKFKKALPLQVNTTKEPLSSGAFGAVFEGKFNGDRVAVKEMTTTRAQEEIIQREMKTHIELNHVNVVKLWDVADSADNKFTHLVLELCAGTLLDYCEKKYSGPKLPPDELVLYQIANGLDYIHSRNLVHRDIKPDNILISMTTPIQMKVSDFTFVKKTRQDIFSQSKIRGAPRWMDPERLKFCFYNQNKPADLPDATIKSDIFSSGCVFFYFLTRGTHPFGKSRTTSNILENKPEELKSFKQNLAADDVNGRTLAGLIEGMIQYEEEKRVGLPEVIKQLAALLYGMDNIKCELQRVEVSLDGKYSIRSHPTKPILACASDKELIFYTAENSSIPFSNWRKKVTCIPQNLVGKSVQALEWNMNGEQLAVVYSLGNLVVWNYQEGKIVFQKKNMIDICQLKWNRTNQNLLVTSSSVPENEPAIFLDDSSNGGVSTPIESKNVSTLEWISENQIAVCSFDTITIFELKREDDNTTTTRLVKKFTHAGSFCLYLEWNERTHCLASHSGDCINIWSIHSERDEPTYNASPIHSHTIGPAFGEISAFAWRPCIGNGEKEGGIDKARKSTRNLTFVYASKSSGIFIWNPLESEQQPRRLSDVTGIQTLAFSSDGRFLAAGSRGTLIIWSAENWDNIYENLVDKDNIDFSWLCTTRASLYEHKLVVNHWNTAYKYGVFEYAFKERLLNSATELATETPNEFTEEGKIDLK